MGIYFDVSQARSVASDLRSAVAPVAEGANGLNEASGAINAMSDTEALKKDGYHRTIHTAAEFVDKRQKKIEEVAQALEDIASVVEHYEQEVLGLVDGQAATVSPDAADWNTAAVG